jgi:hypothetical protein
MCEPAKVVARLTLTHQNGNQTVAEVHDDASFSSFFRIYKRPAGQDEKHLMRRESRIEARDLEQLGEKITRTWKGMASSKVAKGRWNGHLVVDSKVVIIDAEKYVHLLDCEFSQLPGGGQAINRSGGVLAKRELAPSNALPIGYTPLQKRMNIMTGRA